MQETLYLAATGRVRRNEHVRRNPIHGYPLNMRSNYAPAQQGGDIDPRRYSARPQEAGDHPRSNYAYAQEGRDVAHLRSNYAHTVKELCS